MGFRRNPWYDPSRAHHGPKGFRNPDGSRAGHVFSVELAREAAHFMAGMSRAWSEPHPFDESHVLPVDQALAGWNAVGNEARALWMGHASFLMEIAGTRVLTDPFLCDYASPVPMPGTRRLVPSAIPVSLLPGVDIILLSHNHYDHLDVPAMKQLSARFPGVRVVVPLGLAGLMRELGFRHVLERDWWDTLRIESLSITLVPAIHTSRRGVGDTNQSLWCGFVFGDGRDSVYFAGDTAYGGVFRDIGQRCGPVSLGLVPIGAYLPRALMAPVHCTPEEAVLIGADVGARHLVGMHWGTIRLALEPMDEPPKRFLSAPGGPSRQVLRIGETLRFSTGCQSLA